MTELRLPTGKVVLLLLGLCRQGRGPEPLEDRGDGRLWFRWTGLRGGAGAVGVVDDDVEALEALRRASTSARSYVELLAVLACVLMLANAGGQWTLERIAALLYGTRTSSSHRARQLPGIKGFLALLERGYFQLVVPADKVARSTTKASAGEVIAGQLISLERVPGGRARTVRPLPAFLAALGSFTVVVPSSFFALADVGHRNPQGNLPGLAMKARLRLAAAIAARWRRNQPQAMRTDELLRDFAGVDMDRVIRRRHVREWVEEAWRVLKLAKTIGPGLERIERIKNQDGDGEAGSVLRTFLRSVGRIVSPGVPSSRSRAGAQVRRSPARSDARRRSRAPA
ncbi:MAG: hypothetical protein ACLGI2_14340 [Acidimicrobiia bacterium]